MPSARLGPLLRRVVDAGPDELLAHLVGLQTAPETVAAAHRLGVSVTC